MAMRLLFAGTAEFAAIQLRALSARGHTIELVLTQPDRPYGRGLHLLPSAVKRTALELGLACQQPPSLKTPEVQSALAARGVDAWVVAAYGLLLPRAILAAPRLGCINVHASLLPRWRGAAPIQRAIMAGDRSTGISIMRMDEGLDTGPVYLQQAIPILDQDTSGSLHDRLAPLGAQLLIDVLDRLEAGTITAKMQDEAGVTYAEKITRADAQIDWTRPAIRVAQMIRSLDPSPGAYTLFKAQPIKIWRAQAQDDHAGDPPGTILSAGPAGIEVACGEGVIRVTELQRAGGKRLAAAQFVAGFALRAGERFAP